MLVAHLWKLNGQILSMSNCWREGRVVDPETQAEGRMHRDVNDEHGSENLSFCLIG